jgi:hypothetical protein
MTKIKNGPKSRRTKPIAKPSAIKQLFEHLKSKNKKIPRKLRRAVIREMEDDRRQITSKVRDFALKVKSPDSSNPFNESAIIPRFKSRLVELWDQEMNPKGFDMPDLLNPRQKQTGKLRELVWLEKGYAEIPAADGKPAELRETGWKPTAIKPEGVKKYLEDAERRTTELKESGVEATPNYQGQVPVQNMDLAGKFYPYPPSSFTRQLYIPDQWFMLARAAHAYNYNPLAKAAMDIKSSFIIGNGPTLIINNNPELDKVVKQFFKTEDFVETLRVWCTMLGVNGELFIEFLLDVMGKPAVHSIDPGHVYEIITVPRDIRQVLGIKLMFQTQYQIFGTGARGETVPLTEWIYETIAPDNVMHIKLNVQENEKRGRSDLLSCLAVLQLFEDYIRYKVLRAIVEAALVWNVTLTGADQQQIDDFLSNEQQTFPPPGSTVAGNESTKRELLSNQTGGSGKDEVFEMLISIVAVSTNQPKEYLGASSSGSRANAITSTEPSVKGYQARRRKLESLIMRIIDFLASSSHLPYDPDQVEISWEEIAPEDVNKKIDRLYTELDRNTFTKKRIDSMIAKLESVSNYDWETEMNDCLQDLTSGVVAALNNGTKPTLGMGLDAPETPHPVVAPAAPSPGSSAGGQTTATAQPVSSGAPSSLSAQDRVAVKQQGTTL